MSNNIVSAGNLTITNDCVILGKTTLNDDLLGKNCTLSDVTCDNLSCDQLNVSNNLTLSDLVVTHSANFQGVPSCSTLPYSQSDLTNKNYCDSNFAFTNQNNIFHQTQDFTQATIYASKQPTTTNNETVATCSFVKSLINELIGGASSSYDTLLEIQQVLQDENTSINTILETYATLNTSQNMSNKNLTVSSCETPTLPNSISNKKYVDDQITNNKNNTTFTGITTINGSSIFNNNMSLSSPYYFQLGAGGAIKTQTCDLTDTKLNYLSTITSDLQSQLNEKSNITINKTNEFNSANNFNKLTSICGIYQLIGIIGSNTTLNTSITNKLYREYLITSSTSINIELTTVISLFVGQYIYIRRSLIAQTNMIDTISMLSTAKPNVYYNGILQTSSFNIQTSDTVTIYFNSATDIFVYDKSKLNGSLSVTNSVTTSILTSLNAKHSNITSINGLDPINFNAPTTYNQKINAGDIDSSGTTNFNISNITTGNITTANITTDNITTANITTANISSSLTTPTLSTPIINAPIGQKINVNAPICFNQPIFTKGLINYGYYYDYGLKVPFPFLCSVSNNNNTYWLNPNSDDAWILLPQVKVILYTSTNYTGSSCTIENTGTLPQLFDMSTKYYGTSKGPNKTSSFKVYVTYNGIDEEILITGIS